jgi:hypothetical protein
MTPYETTSIVSQIESPLASTKSSPVDVTVAPGTVAVITVPPIEPTLGEIDTN